MILLSLKENEYLGHTVARITALGPDVVLVHRSVSRLAQDRFRQSGVTLVLNVKLSVLERVARCTGATIVKTIDAHLATRYKLGTCKTFYLRNFLNEKRRALLLFSFLKSVARTFIRGVSEKYPTSVYIFAPERSSILCEV